ncbi:hypothetical protein ACFFX0_05655 [Citricoccus parietis]|uniref:Uncharacterized protein n=1 Tax=Citricoccus parietis TaxID=592307 RepID=A0ABV5FVL5_9MICC
MGHDLPPFPLLPLGEPPHQDPEVHRPGRAGHAVVLPGCRGRSGGRLGGGRDRVRAGRALRPHRGHPRQDPGRGPRGPRGGPGGVRPGDHPARNRGDHRPRDLLPGVRRRRRDRPHRCGDLVRPARRDGPAGGGGGLQR